MNKKYNYSKKYINNQLIILTEEFVDGVITNVWTLNINKIINRKIIYLIGGLYDKTIFKKISKEKIKETISQEEREL
tara:strand:+ start:6119 stop:6349 length:231 start_codon:yes stop_codon:yes gene_type:complete